MLAGVGVLALAGAGTAIAATAVRIHSRAAAGRQGGIPVRATFGFAGAHAFGRHGFGRRAGPRDDLAAAASYLGTTAADLLTQLQSGKTLAQIANGTSGKSAAGLVAALVAHEKQELAHAVSAGRLTQAQADAISAGLEKRFTMVVNGVRPDGGPGFGHHGPGRLLGTAASYLGVTTAALLADLQSGKTLAQIADATSGKSAAGLVAALVAQGKKELADAVTAGRLTQAQADAISADLQQRVTDLVNGARPAFGGPGPRHGWSPYGAPGHDGPPGAWTGGNRI